MATKTVIGVFDSRTQAERAVDEIQGLGVSRDDISIVTRDDRRTREGREESGRREERETLEARAGRGEGSERGMRMGGENVTTGMSWGGGVGGLAGILAGAGALAIPGIGPILAAGPLAAALTGAVTGGLAGGLIDWGVPEARGRAYEEKVRQGGILTVVRTSEDRAERVADAMRRNGASDVATHDLRR